MRVLLTLVLLTATAAADQVTLKNGDRLTGTIVKSDTKALTLKSEFAGTVAIDWGAVDAITSTNPVYLTLKSGQVLLGPVETMSGGSIQVKTADAGTVTTAKAEVENIRSKEEQAAYNAEIDRYRNPRLLDLWAG